MEIGERIKARREELGMSQDELARMVGYKWRSSINKIELGGQRLPQKKIVEIARALRVTPSYLMGWEDNMYIDDEGNPALAAELTAIQEELVEKVFMLVPTYQTMLLDLIDKISVMDSASLKLLVKIAGNMVEEDGEKK